MSEHYDFHYQPTGSGAISGQQVLEQTEDAINELGDYVNNNVGGAMDVAQQALETAQNAETNAQTALDTANSFSSAIQSAQQDASTALSTAQTAQTTASNANNTAIQAQQDASNAVTTANNASGQVSTLSGTVTALGQRVTTAEGNIGQNTSDITALTTRVGTAEGNITTLQNDISIAMGNASSAMATAGQVKQQAFVFRYSSTALVASSTNSNTLLDNTDNLKVGDKVIDSDGVLFSITAIDTANSTFTVGSALIDLALDANVVHTSGNETINGVKSFNDKMTLLNAVRGIDITSQTIDCNDLTSNAGGDIKLYRCTSLSGASNISNIPLQTAFILIVLQTKFTGSLDTRAIQKFYDVGSSSQPISYTRALYNGTWSAWQLDDYALNSDVVHTSGNETISGNKTITDSNLEFKSTSAEYGVSAGDSSVIFRDKNNRQTFKIYSRVFYSGVDNNLVSFFITQKVDNTYYNSNGIQLYTNTNNKNVVLRPILANNNADDLSVSLGASDRRWSDVQTYNVNGLTPSSLGMPSNTSVDISGYVTDFSGGNNPYKAPDNGFISLDISGTNRYVLYNKTLSAGERLTGSNFRRESILQVRKDDVIIIQLDGGTLNYAKFYPCLGNV